jgi:hypothetical protein
MEGIAGRYISIAKGAVADSSPNSRIKTRESIARLEVLLIKRGPASPKKCPTLTTTFTAGNSELPSGLNQSTEHLS